MEIIYTFYFFCLFEKSDQKTIDILLLEVRNGLYDIERDRRKVGRGTS